MFAPSQGNEIVSDFAFREGDRIDLQGQAFSLDRGDEVWTVSLEAGNAIIVQGVAPNMLEGLFAESILDYFYRLSAALSAQDWTKEAPRPSDQPRRFFFGAGRKRQRQ